MSDDRRAYWRAQYHKRRAQSGRPLRKPGRPPLLGDAELVRLLAAVAAGERIADVAQAMGISEGTVRRYAHRAGLRRRAVERPSGGQPRPPHALPWWESGLTSP